MARARVVCTTKADGDFNADLVDARLLDERRRAVVDGPWTWLDEVHGADVVVVRAPGDCAGVAADAAVTRATGAVVSVWVGDCAPVALLAQEAVGVVHAGWRGLRGAARFGGSVRSTTAWGTPALAVSAAVRHDLERLGVDLRSTGPCTGCDPDRFWSYRMRGEAGRQAMAVWIEPEP